MAIYQSNQNKIVNVNRNPKVNVSILKISLTSNTYKYNNYRNSKFEKSLLIKVTKI